MLKTKPVVPSLIAGILAFGTSASAATPATPATPAAPAAARAAASITIKIEGTASAPVTFRAKVTGTAGKYERLVLAGDPHRCAATEVKEGKRKAIVAFLPFAGIRVHPVFSHTYSLDSSGPLFDSNYLCAYLIKSGPKVTSPATTVAFTGIHYDR